ncbi:MAG: CBS domain-containing membrane protein [Gammaproteobacteria bacterium]|jgi:CBS domain-containing membrane protein
MTAKNRHELSVADLMSTDMLTLRRNDTLLIADELMKQKRVRHLPVLDENGELCGMVTQRDLFRGAVLTSLGYGSRAEEMMLASLAVKDAMTENPITVTSALSLEDAARLMLTHSIGSLPVIDGGRLVGILTEGDFVRLAISE